MTFFRRRKLERCRRRIAHLEAELGIGPPWHYRYLGINYASGPVYKVDRGGRR